MVKECNLKTHIKVCQAYITKWTPKNGKILNARPQPESEYDKYTVAVERCGDVFGHLSKKGLHVSPKPFRIFYVQEIKTAIGLK